ncbi:hypothetical protein SAMN05428989_1977 [Pseudoxanthomonas sp. GM95]|uniref:hypothetical protein n=1 Tax=Pseudoxanthomonas sp. GM95 TaxID=1881043 RepID=UPI0008C72DB0|nr:hypothetical protein [Pseudoxanthomonas sp. GM95]SEL58048.1 hypothetical protein SAMN05428989_1977 [Pseudoxanthomonas sp. GM95]
MSKHDHNYGDLPDDANRDPITGAPGSHPVGVGVGGVIGGAAAGAAAGTVLGPIGTLIGAAVGVVVGSAAGKGVAERIDPTMETEYWRGEFANRPYVDPSKEFDRDYATAYGFGLQARELEPGRRWEEREAELEKQWPAQRGTSTLEWDQAREAARDSWYRADRTYGTYAGSDDYFRSRFDHAAYREQDSAYEDYAPAYRYGTRSRFSTDFGGRKWDDTVENDLRLGWESAKHHSRLTWDQAKGAVHDAFTSDEPFDGGRKG